MGKFEGIYNKDVKRSLELAYERYEKMANLKRRKVKYLVDTEVWLATKNLLVPMAQWGYTTSSLLSGCNLLRSKRMYT